MKIRHTIAGTFDPGAPHVARRPFTLQGRRVQPGDPVDLAGVKRGRTLYEGRYVVKAPPVEEVVEVPRAIRHRGGGYYDVVDADGNVVSDRALRREEAEALV